jgi:hypothetical protein
MSNSISVKEISNTKFNGIISSQLVLEIKGINSIIANTLRRIVHDDIPIYGFPSELIQIEQNTSIYNNDQIKDHLMQIPILNIDSGLFYLDPMYWKDIDYKDLNRNKHPKEKTIELYVNIHNTTSENMFVTTDNAKIYINGEIIDMWKDYKHKPVLMELKPDTIFKCHMKSALGTGERNAIWSSGLAFPYAEGNDDKPDKIVFTLESFGQINEYAILVKACDYIIYKLTELKKHIEKLITEGKISSKKTLILELEDEDHTLGNVVNDVLQDHPNIIFSGVSKPDHLVKLIRLKIECDDKYPTPIEPIYQSIDKLKTIYNKIKSELNDLINKEPKNNKEGKK